MTGWRLHGVQRHRPICRCVGLLVVFLAAARVQAETLSVMEFNEKIRDWKTDQKIPPPITYTVEGRLSVYGKDRLRLRNCDVPFISQAEIPKLSRKSANIEVSGKVVVDSRSGEYTVAVSLVREVASDYEKFQESSRRLRQQPAEKWYELGKWAEVRGNFYKDDDLLTRAAKAFAHGIDVERKAMAHNDRQGLLDLAEKAKTFRLSLALSQELTHEAYHLLLQESRKMPKAELEDLAKDVARNLPGASDPLRFLPGDLVKQYAERPLETYAAADSETRRKIHRLLYDDVMLRTVTPDLAADGSNGFQVADEIDRLLPEYHVLAEEYRDKALAARAANIEKLTKSQMLEVAEKYRLRQKPRAAERLIEKWLEMRRGALEPDDTEGLLELTDEYRRLLKQGTIADRLLLDAWKRNPKAQDIAERLEKEGYHLFEGKWLTSHEYNDRPEGRLEKAIHDGRVEKGMTVSDVRRSLGEPVTLARAVTAGAVSELWTYTLSDRSNLVVRLVKRAGQRELTVDDVADVKRR